MKQQKPIPRRTKKRANQEKEYLVLREVYIETQRVLHPQRKLFCIFCGKEIKGEPSLHHGLGRDDEMLLQPKFWFLSHNFCHVSQYHSMSWSKLPWWNEYLERIKEYDEIYKKELKRMDK